MKWTWGTLGLPQFWTYLAAVAGFVTLLYLLKLRRRKVQVPFGPLWTKVFEERQTTRLFQRLKRIFSWLVQLAIAALVLFALTDPKVKDWKLIKVSAPQKRHIVMIIDTSASMTATDVKGQSRFSGALRAARQVVDQLGVNDRLMLIEMAGNVRSGTFIGHKKGMLAALDKLAPKATGTNFKEALALAKMALEDKKHGLLLLLSDGAFDAIAQLKTVKFPYRFIQFGQSAGNVGITQLNVRPYLDDSLRFETYLRVKNYSDKPLKAKVTFYTQPHPSDRRDPGHPKRSVKLTSPTDLLKGMMILNTVAIDIPAGSEKVHVIKDQKLLENRMAAHLELDKGQAVRDVFPADDVAFALVPERRKIRVLAVTVNNTYLHAALFLRENVTFKVVEPAKFGAEKLSGYDMVILDRFLPQPFPEKGNFLIIEPKAGGPFTLVGDKVVVAPQVGKINRRHRLTRHVTFEDLQLIYAVPVKLRAGDKAPVRTKSGWPLIITRSRKLRKLVAFTFDLRKSTLPVSPTFPILLVDTINWFFDEDQHHFVGYQSGSHLSVPVAHKGARVAVTTPAGQTLRVPIYENKARFYAATAGFYRLAAKNYVDYVAVNLRNEEEAAIKPRRKRFGPTTQVSALKLKDTRTRTRPWSKFWRSLLLAALGLSILEWVTYHRRWTV